VSVKNKITTFLPEEEIEPQALDQIYNTAKMPFVEGLAVMPDCHLGAGSTVGSVIATNGAIIPAAVGVDIGCGMIAARTMYNVNQLPSSLKEMRLEIEAAVPLGPGGKHKDLDRVTVRQRIHRLLESPLYRLDDPDYYTDLKKDWMLQLGTLGSGNHFIEVCVEQYPNTGAVWVVLHSGSRGIGLQLAQRHIKIAQQLCMVKNVSLPHTDLAYLQDGSREFNEYTQDLLWAQEYAAESRAYMMELVIEAFEKHMPKPRGMWYTGASIRFSVNCHHNFSQKELHWGKDLWITRKGAIQMNKDQYGVIPGSMGTKSYIVRGLGNEHSYCSAPHGAGRRLSRSKAKATLDPEVFKAQMSGVEWSGSAGLIDEAPDSYKDIDRVMEQSKSLVRIENVLKQVLSVKGG
jgi:tRNA-splicing ligase RtcB (3'-phosphate/5'-hydroxy nucleic acid ligase)